MHKKGQNRMALPLNVFSCKSVLVRRPHARRYELTLGLCSLGIAVPKVTDHRNEDIGDHKEKHNTGVQSDTYIVTPVTHRAFYGSAAHRALRKGARAVQNKHDRQSGYCQKLFHT